MSDVTDEHGNPIQPRGWQGSGPDFELQLVGRRWAWEAYDEDVLIGVGRARTRLGAFAQMARFRRRWRAAEGR